MTNKIKTPAVEAGVNDKTLNKIKSQDNCTVNNPVKAHYPAVSFTLVTSNSNPMTKIYAWDIESNSFKNSRCGNLVDGKLSRIDASLDTLLNEMKGFGSKHALIHGVASYKNIDVCTKDNLIQGSISRTSDNFKYPENSLLLFDYDPSERGQTINNVEDFIKIIESINPQLKHCAYISKPSASSGIKLKDKIVNDNKGLHIYFAIQGDLQKYAKTLFQRLVLDGYGHVFISASGSRQVRSIFDTTVHKSERLDFVAPAIVELPLTIDKNSHVYSKRPGGYIDTSGLPNLTQGELDKYNAICIELLNDATNDAYAIRELYLVKHSRTTNKPIERLRLDYQLGDSGEIDFDHQLVKNDGTLFSFSEALDSEFKYHKLSMRDPFEPDYGKDKAMLFINKDGSLAIHSYCHGETTYKVTKDGVLYLRADESNLPIFRTMEIDEILKEPPPLEWLVKDYILPESQVMVVGPSEIGKTFLTIDMALSIATGRNWNSRVVKQGPVAYINAEGQRSMQYRIKGWEQEHQSLANAPFLLSQDACDLMSDESIEAAIIKLDKFAIKHNRSISIIFIDTLHRNMSGDEDRSPDIRTFMNNLEYLCRRYGAAGFINHHPGHGNNGRARGSSSMKAALDTELLLNKDTKSGIVSLSCEKLKDGGEKPKPVEYSIKQISTSWLDTDGKQVTTCVAEYNQLSSGQIKQLFSNKPTPAPIIVSIEALISSFQKLSISASEKDWRNEFNKIYKANWKSVKANKQNSFKKNSMNRAFTKSRNTLVGEQVISCKNGRWEFTDLKKSTWSDIGQYAVANPLVIT
jgi:hypothetical protein